MKSSIAVCALGAALALAQGVQQLACYVSIKFPVYTTTSTSTATNDAANRNLASTMSSPSLGPMAARLVAGLATVVNRTLALVSATAPTKHAATPRMPTESSRSRPPLAQVLLFSPSVIKPIRQYHDDCLMQELRKGKFRPVEVTLADLLFSSCPEVCRLYWLSGFKHQRLWLVWVWLRIGYSYRQGFQ